MKNKHQYLYLKVQQVISLIFVILSFSISKAQEPSPTPGKFHCFTDQVTSDGFSEAGVQGPPTCWPKNLPPCEETISYAPESGNESKTPLKYIRVTLHIFQNHDDPTIYLPPGNFTNSEEHLNVLRSWFDDPNKGINARLSNLCNPKPKVPGFETPHITDSRVRFDFRGIEYYDVFFYNNPTLWGGGSYCGNSSSYYSSMRNTAIINNPVVQSNPDILNSLHVFMPSVSVNSNDPDCSPSHGLGGYVYMGASCGNLDYFASSVVFGNYYVYEFDKTGQSPFNYHRDPDESNIPNGGRIIMAEWLHLVSVDHPGANTHLDYGGLDDQCNDTPHNDIPDTPSTENNIMDTYLDENDRCALTQCQLGRLHHFLDELTPYNVRTEDDINQYPSSWHECENFLEDLVVQGNTIDWEEEQKVYSDIIVKSGTTLKINCDLYMAHNSSIIIEPNAQVFLNAKITSMCEDKPWQGIKVWGSDSTKSQYSVGGTRAQGRFIGQSGSIIENAEIAVQLYGPTISHTGGQIRCTATTFRNNRIGVKFAPYQNFWPYAWPTAEHQGQPRSYFGNFTSCIFENNNDYIHDLGFVAFLHMTGVNGVRIKGCHLSNTQSLPFNGSVADYGYGILATDAGFKVEAKCTGNTYPCNNYQHSSFEGLGYGIYTATITKNKPYLVKQTDFSNCFVGLHNSAVSSGTILFNDFYLGNVPNSSVTSKQLGVVFENNISGFTFEENDFIGTGGNASLTVGTLSKNIGFFNNKVRRNNYSNLSIGNLSNGENATSSSFDRGLHYLCNNNSNSTQFDFSVPNGPGIDRIRPSQGLEYQEDETGDILYKAAGNRFSYTSTDFENQGSSVDYYYHPSAMNETPITFTGNFTAINALGNNCPETYCEPPCITQQEVAQKKDKYYDDKTKEEQAKIESYSAISSGETELAIQKEKEAEYYKQRMDKEAYMVVLHLMHDTLMFDPDTLALWIENLDAFGMDMIFALSQQSDGNHASAQKAFSRAANRTDLSATQRKDIADMRTLMSILERKSPYALPQSDLKALERLAVRDESFTGNISRNILSLYGRHYPISFRLPDGKTATLRTLPQTVVAKKESDVKLNPNPASKEVNLLWQPPRNSIDSGEVIFRDVSGRVLHRVEIQAHKNLKIPLLNMPSGVVFYQLQTTAGIITTGKLIVK